MAIQVVIKDSHELIIVFAYNAKRIERVRLIDGRYWDAARKHWLVPFTDKAIWQVRTVFYDEAIDWGAGIR
jgi:hypothetical protein